MRARDRPRLLRLVRRRLGGDDGRDDAAVAGADGGGLRPQARGGSADVTPQSLLRTTLFTAGYLLAWVLVGIVAWVVFEAVRSLDISFLAWDDGGPIRRRGRDRRRRAL